MQGSKVTLVLAPKVWYICITERKGERERESAHTSHMDQMYHMKIAFKNMVDSANGATNRLTSRMRSDTTVK